MKFEIYSDSIDGMCLRGFFDRMRLFADELGKSDPTLKKVQMYSDFFTPEQFYPFMSETTIYYPLTLIYPKKQWKILWVCWENLPMPPKCRIFTPFHAKTIEVCEHVPEEFRATIDQMLDAGISLAAFQNAKHARASIGRMAWEQAGRVNVSFMDELSRQISEQLIALAGESLSSEWELELTDALVVKRDEKKYLHCTLRSPYSFGMSIGVSWEGRYEPYYFLRPNMPIFSLTNASFQACSAEELAELKSFVVNKRFFFPHTPQETDETPVDATIRVRFYTKASARRTDAVLKYIQEYVVFWNEQETDETSEEKIHDFFLLDSENQRTVTVYVDLGNCSGEVLEALIAHLKQGLQKENLLGAVEAITVNES